MYCQTNVLIRIIKKEKEKENDKFWKDNRKMSVQKDLQMFGALKDVYFLTK